MSSLSFADKGSPLSAGAKGTQLSTGEHLWHGPVGVQRRALLYSKNFKKGVVIDFYTLTHSIPREMKSVRLAIASFNRRL